jgi:type II secretory pathway pseudopilin PulG
MRYKLKKSFVLIELMILLAIVGMIAGVVSSKAFATYQLYKASQEKYRYEAALLSFQNLAFVENATLFVDVQKTQQQKIELKLHQFDRVYLNRGLKDLSFSIKVDYNKILFHPDGRVEYII